MVVVHEFEDKKRKRELVLPKDDLTSNKAISKVSASSVLLTGYLDDLVKGKVDSSHVKNKPAMAKVGAPLKT